MVPVHFSSRVCVKCSTDKPLTEFYKDSSYRDGFKRSCKLCVIAVNLAAYRANPEVWKVRRKAWGIKNPEVVRRLERRRQRSMSSEKKKLRSRLKDLKRRARGFSGGGSVISGMLVAQRGRCATCSKRLGQYHVDHVLPIALGGTSDKDNLQLLCPPCNLRKGARHPVDFAQSLGRLL